MGILVTKHAEDRMRERMGLPRKACQRMADRAWELGERGTITYTGLRELLNVYENKVFEEGSQAVLYGKFIYIFCQMRLVTVFLLKTDNGKLHEQANSEKHKPGADTPDLHVRMRGAGRKRYEKRDKPKWKCKSHQWYEYRESV